MENLQETLKKLGFEEVLNNLHITKETTDDEIYDLLELNGHLDICGVIDELGWFE